nr:hypothetical protein [Tanacetum cinerariifolium]
MADNRTMAELLQATTEGYEDAIVLPEITANNFKLKHSLINLIFPPSKTTNLRNEITRFQQRFDESFYEAWERFNDLLRACLHHGFSELHQLDTFYNALNVNDQDSLNSAAGGNFLDEMPRECLKIIESKSKSSAPTPSTTPAPVKAVKPNCVTCGGAHAYQNCLATHENAYRDNIQEYVSQAAATNYNQGNTGFRPQMVNQAHVYQAPIPQTQRVSQTDFKSYVKVNDAILRNMQSQGQSTQNQCQNIQNQYQNLQNQMATLTDMMSKLVSANTASSFGSGTLPGNTITNPKEELKGITTRSGVAYQGPKTPSPSKQGTKVTKDQVQTPSSQNTAPVQPLVIQSESQASVSEPVVAPVSAPMPNLNLSFLTLQGVTMKNAEKLSEMARTTMNEHCLAVILNKLPRKLGDPGKFLIPCEFSRMDECLALADLVASINLMPLSVWEGVLLPELTPTCMTLKLVDRSVSKPIGIAKDVSFKVGVFHFLADFMVVDFEPDPRVPLILGRFFLKTSRALIDVHKGELTLRIGNEAITYNLDQTVRYSANYNQMTANKIDVIESACEEYSQEVLGFSNVTASGTPTPQNDPVVSATSPTLTLFGDSDFLLFEEAGAFFGLEDDPDSPKVNLFYYDPKGDILLLEAILNKVELKDLPHHLEYAFLEGDNKLPIIIAKELRSEEKSTLIKVLKSYKRAIAWKLSDIQGINPEFYTNKILMEEDYKLAVQHQRRVNPKIHDVIKKEVEKLLDAGLIYPISDSPWVSPTMEVFMDNFLVFGNSFKNYLSCLDKMFQRCEDTNLSLNWEKSHFMVKEGIVLGHKISKNGIEVDKAKIDVIAKLPHPTTVKGIRSFLDHAGFYRRFIQDFSKISRLMTHLLEKNTPLVFSEDCAVLGQRHEKHFKPIHYASKTTNDAKTNYTTTEKEMLAVVMLRQLLLQEFNFPVLDTKGAENLTVDHLSRLENLYENVLDLKEINETFPLETLSMVTFRGDSSALWFADFANYHAGNFIVKGMTSQQKNKFFKDVYDGYLSQYDQKTMKVFMDDFSVFGNSFRTCLSHLDKMLQRCEDTNLCLNWEKSHFMVKEGIVLGHKISKNGIEVDKAKVDVITKLPHPTTVKGGPIAPIAIQAMNFGLKNDMIQQVQNSCQFHGLSGDDANKHLDKFLHVTQSIKVNGVTDYALRLYLFPHSSTHHATAWFDCLPRNSINTFEQMAKMFLGKYFPPSMVTKLRNEITNFRQRPDESLFEAWERYKLSIDHSLKAEMEEINKNLMKVLQINQQVKAVTPSYETCGGPHSYNDCPAIVGQTQNVYAAGAYQGGNSYQPQAVTSNLDQTSRDSANYNDMTANRIDVIDMACEEYFQEVLGFSDLTASGNPTPYYDPIVSTSSLTLTPFEDSDFLLKEVDAFLALEDDPTSPKVDQSYYDTEGDILLLEAFLNDDPSLPSPTQGICEAKNNKSSIDEPPKVELKDLPPHLEYAFLEGNDKFHVIIAKDLSVEEKAALIKVLKSQKQAIAWKLSDIKGINPKFCTHKILIEDDFELAVQHQRRVNPKIHEEKSHFMVKEDILLGHKISKNGIEVDKAKVDVITKLHHPTTIKGIRSFLGHAGFYRRFIQDISKIAQPMTHLLIKDTSFFFSNECIEAFQTLKRKLTEAPILVAPDWDLPFELMCDASDFSIGVVLGQRKSKHFQPIHFASKTMIDAQAHYTITEIELLSVVKPLTFSRLALMDPPGDIMAQTTPSKRCLTLDFISPQSIVMPTTWSNLVTLVNVRERFYNGMKCLKITSKFATFLTFGASISWGHSRLHEGTSIYLWLSITCQNRLKRKCSPLATPKLFVNSSNLSLLGLELHVPSLVIMVRTSAMTSSQRSCISMVSLTFLLPRITLNKWTGGNLQSWFKKNLRKDSGREPCLLVG